MLIENSFEVPASLDRAWAYLLDVERVAPCLPGAELTETVDERTWKGKVNVKLGPVSLSFAGTVVMQERDDAAHRVVLKASGMEQRGKGAATALVTGQLEEGDGVTKVHFSQDITISGAVAQFSRGMMQDVSSRLTKQFAECVRTNMSADPPNPGNDDPPVQVAARPVKGFRLAVWALFRAIGRFFARLFGRRPAAGE
jgi:uncharacterized protein